MTNNAINTYSNSTSSFSPFDKGEYQFGPFCIVDLRVRHVVNCNSEPEGFRPSAQEANPRLTPHFRKEIKVPQVPESNQSFDQDLSSLEIMAASASTSSLNLKKLLWHPAPEIRAAIADNKNTPLACLWVLANDSDPDVRYQLAENHQIALPVLNLLADDENPYVACRARRTISRLQTPA